jgi:hypothetical protein
MGDPVALDVVPAGKEVATLAGGSYVVESKVAKFRKHFFAKLKK